MYKIDYVVTYLDPTDEYWLEQFKPYQQIEFKKQKARYDDDGLTHFKYHFRGIAKYMPWINNVYLVVFSESQVPKWINRDTVKIVTDDMYIPKKFLPTFNTSTKQMHLQFIPGLEEHFLFADDDQFVINEISPFDFYDGEGNPLSEKINSKNVFKPRDNTDIWENIVYNSTKFAYDALELPYKERMLIGQPAFHTPHSMLKSDLIHYYNKCSTQIEQSITPCRAETNILGLGWITINGLKYQNKSSLTNYSVFGRNMYDDHDINEIKSRGTHIFTINVNVKGDYYQKQLQQLFPDKCKYEV